MSLLLRICDAGVKPVEIILIHFCSSYLILKAAQHTSKPVSITKCLGKPLNLRFFQAFTHVLTYSQSIAFEQSTPAALFFNDSSLLACTGNQDQG